MTNPSSEQRAAALLRWYPRTWRERYADEFTEMLCLDIEERPRSAARSIDVARAGFVARLSVSGLCGESLSSLEQSKSSQGWVFASLVVAAAVGGSIWSQLAIGAQWEHPYSPGESVATNIMSIAIVAALVMIAAAIALAVCSSAVGALRHRDRSTWWPLALVATSATALALGARHFAGGWPGLNGHLHHGQPFVPRSVASWTWAATSSVTTYWFHPSELQRFPASEVAWMAISATLVVVLSFSLVVLLRRAPTAPMVHHCLSVLARGAFAVVAMFAAGAIWWITHNAAAPTHHPANLFSLGAIDLVGAAALMGLLALAYGQMMRAGHRRAENYSRISGGVS